MVMTRVITPSPAELHTRPPAQHAKLSGGSPPFAPFAGPGVTMATAMEVTEADVMMAQSQAAHDSSSTVPTVASSNAGEPAVSIIVLALAVRESLNPLSCLLSCRHRWCEGDREEA